MIDFHLVRGTRRAMSEGISERGLTPAVDCTTMLLHYALSRGGTGHLHRGVFFSQVPGLRHVASVHVIARPAACRSATTTCSRRGQLPLPPGGVSLMLVK